MRTVHHTISKTIHTNKRVIKENKTTDKFRNGDWTIMFQSRKLSHKIDEQVIVFVYIVQNRTAKIREKSQTQNFNESTLNSRTELDFDYHSN